MKAVLYCVSGLLLFWLGYVVGDSRSRHSTFSEKHGSAHSSALPLSLFVVKQGPFEGSVELSVPEYSLKGFTQGDADLVISKIEAVSRKRTNDKPARPELVITLRPDEAMRFSALLERTAGHHLLIRMGSRTLAAPYVRSAFKARSFQIVLNADDEAEEVHTALEKLIG